VEGQPKDAKRKTISLSLSTIGKKGDRDRLVLVFFSQLTFFSPFHPSSTNQLTTPTDTAGVFCIASDARRGSNGRPEGPGEVLVIVVIIIVELLAFVDAFASRRRQHRPRRVRCPRRGRPGARIASRIRDGRFRRRR